MKVKLEPAPGAIVEILLANGKIVQEEVVSVTVTPFFESPNRAGGVLLGECLTNNGRQVDKFQLTASGCTGKLSKVGSKGGVTPMIDKVPATKADNKGDKGEE